MKTLVRWIDRLSFGGGVLAGVMLCAGLALVVIEIVLRTGFSNTLFVTEEYSGYLMCGLTFCALAYTLRERGHIRMTFLLKAVQGRPRIYLDIICFSVGLIFFAGLTYFVTLFFWDSVVSRSRSMQISETYLAIPQFFMLLGAFLMTFQFFGEILRAVDLLKNGTDESAAREESHALGR
ncbi:MAG: TRAP transporter small permease [Desulfatiglandaceae bacterium]